MVECKAIFSDNYHQQVLSCRHNDVKMGDGSWVEGIKGIESGMKDVTQHPIERMLIGSL